jgi:hypothetical protein
MAFRRGKLFINIIRAPRALAVAMPQSLSLRADVVIQ